VNGRPVETLVHRRFRFPFDMPGKSGCSRQMSGLRVYQEIAEMEWEGLLCHNRATTFSEAEKTLCFFQRQ
jgi:hypothetical protein